MTIRIDKITVLGTGVLGSQIAYQAAYRGFAVTAPAARTRPAGTKE